MKIDKKLLNWQKKHWDNNFLKKPSMFGNSPSEAALMALKFFKSSQINNIIEIGAGQGRDTFFFAENNIKITALDYSKIGINQIKKQSRLFNKYKNIKTKCHDVRLKLPFENRCFDACFSHMLYCMALTKKELLFLSKEINRILKPGGLNIYTVRNFDDGDYKKGDFIGENIFETDGFIIHFFSKKNIEYLSHGFKTLKIKKFEEGNFPRKLFIVIQKKI